jgi:endo-1,3-1,4-beta-glycanase ExoK
MFRFILASISIALFALPAHAGYLPFFKNSTTIDTKLWYTSEGWANGPHQSCEWRADHLIIRNRNLVMRLSDKGGQKRPIGCAELQSTQRYHYGTYEARIRSAAGSGLNTGFFTYIGPPLGVPQWDEIDFEFLGKDPKTVQLNYFVNGKSSGGHIVQLGFDASKAFHNYRFDWLPDKIIWYVDGKKVHETPKGAALPKQPGKLMLTLWSNSAQLNDWMGPFTYTGPKEAEVAWVKYTPMKR